MANHRSFLDEQELLLIPSAPGRDHEILTVAAIYGANASGKSNLLDGLRFMAQAVRESFQRWPADGGVPRKPFRLRQEGRLQPSTFVVEVVINGVPYNYGFSVDEHKVVEEWLYSYPEKRKRLLFERAGLDVRFGSTVSQLKSKLDVLEELTRENALFLSLAAQSKLEPLVPVYRWFTSGLHFQLNRSHPSGPRVLRRVGLYLAGAEANRHKLVRLLAEADTGITDLLMEEQPTLFQLDVDGRDTPFNPEIMELRFVHGDDSDARFGIEDESAGTRNWLYLLPSVLHRLERGGVIVVDEIDASLHPLLTVRLLHLFSSAETNPKRAQLIFTTHDTTPLGSYVGRDVLQRDQVWFVEKDIGGHSKLYPLSDFKPRIGENAQKRYLGGSYGAVPVLSDVDFGESVREQA